MIYGFYGHKGGGKSIMMVVFAYLFFLSGRRVLSNIKLGFKHEIVNAKDIIELSPKLINTVLLLDEIHMMADSRLSTKFENRCVGYFALQSRHRDCELLYTTQHQGQCDKRIRMNTDIKIICENLYIDSDGDGYNDMFRIVINDLRLMRSKVFTLYLKPFFNMYDTKEIINPFHRDDIRR